MNEDNLIAPASQVTKATPEALRDKTYKRKKKEKGNYVFPNILAKMMKGISPRTQYEAEMLAIVFILFGIITMGIYMVVYSTSTLFVKIMTIVNVLAAFVFLSSRLVTSFQQYQNYLAVVGIIEEVGDGM